MISLEQVRLLETKVKQAVDKIQTLSLEKEELTQKLLGNEERILELENLVKEFKSSQDEIEEGFLKALNQLDELNETETPEAVTSSNSLDEEVQPEVQVEPSAPAQEMTPVESEQETIEVSAGQEESVEDTYSEEESSYEEQAAEEESQIEEDSREVHRSEPQNLEIF
ncbi:hypothetical protein [Spirochaeta cellobiosiphila]|uniref:hypothetical protein n=1 Tax=Spirochaeta cellobiosiphila TaxID=504483 RepID=UPI000423AC24|nr:hypothetical protein [Spirochaeta cellobiosiphila]